MRTLTPTLIFIFLCFTKSFTGIAQQGYKPGYIILPNNDTVSGFLKEQSSRKASRTVVFRKENKGAKAIYTADQIKAYRYEDGKYYISFPITVKGEQKQVFMEYLIKGKANVYYTHDGKEHYYIQKEDGELTELTEPQVYTEINGRRYALPPQYKNKLSTILSDADMQPTIQKTSLEYKSLISLAQEYHEKVCDTEACIVYARKKNRAIRDYTVFAGYYINRYNFGNMLATDYTGGLQIGFQASFKGLFFSNERLGLGAGVFFEKDFSTTLKPYDDNYVNLYTVDYEGERYSIQGGTDYAVYDSKLDANLNIIALRIPLTINYYQPIKKSTLILGLGLSNRITLSRNKDFSIVNYDKPGEQTIKTYFPGLTGIIGYETRIFSSNKLTFNLTGDYVTKYFPLQSITQFTGRIGFTF